MISVEEFLEGRHLESPQTEDGGLDSQIVQDVVRQDVPDVVEGSDDTVLGRYGEAEGRGIGSSARSDAERSRKSGRCGSRMHTHVVPVSSKYTSGFGRRADGEIDVVDRSNHKVQGRGGSRTGSRRYRTNAPVRRVPDDPSDIDACREAALTLLDASARSSGALIKRLVDKGYDPVVAKDVVERLIQVHLIDDEEYARSVVRSCTARMMGFQGVVMEMRRKGVDDQLARRVAAEAEGEGVFEEAAWQLGQKVAAKTQGMARDVRLRRFWGVGGRKGHNPEILRRVGNECFREVSEH